MLLVSLNQSTSSYCQLFQNQNFFIIIIDTYHPYNDELILEVHVRGDPKPKVEWLKDTNLLFPTDRWKFREGLDGIYQLRINAPRKYADSGRYTCRATNSGGVVEDIRFIRFLGKEEEDKSCAEYRRTKKMLSSRHITPKDEDEWDTELYHSKRHEPKKEYDHRYKLTWITQLKDQTVPQGSTLKFTVFVDGKYPQFEWNHNGIPLVHGRRYRHIVLKDGKGCLQVNNAQPSDSGLYQLTAKNYANSIECECKVTVYDYHYKDFEPPLFINTLQGENFFMVLLFPLFCFWFLVRKVSIIR